MKPIHAAFLPLLVAGCAPVAELSRPPQLVAVAEAVAPVPPVSPAPPLIYTRHEITAPADWRSLNDAQAPEGSGL